MKKVLFSAIAMVAFAGSAFASNEVVFEEKVPSEKQVKGSLFEENVLDDKRECLTFTETIKQIDGTTVKKTRTVCSYHHTEKEIEEAIEKLEGIEIN